MNWAHVIIKKKNCLLFFGLVALHSATIQTADQRWFERVSYQALRHPYLWFAAHVGIGTLSGYWASRAIIRSDLGLYQRRALFTVAGVGIALGTSISHILPDILQDIRLARMMEQVTQEAQSQLPITMRSNIVTIAKKIQDLLGTLHSSLPKLDQDTKALITQQYKHLLILDKTLQRNLQESGFQDYQSLYKSLLEGADSNAIPFEEEIFTQFASVLQKMAESEAPETALNFVYKELSSTRDALSAKLAPARAAEEAMPTCPICAANETDTACQECEFQMCSACYKTISTTPPLTFEEEVVRGRVPLEKLRACPGCRKPLAPLPQQAGPALRENIVEQPQQQEVQPAAAQGLWQRLRNWWRGA